jgi:hypothetical protein
MKKLARRIRIDLLGCGLHLLLLLSTSMRSARLLLLAAGCFLGPPILEAQQAAAEPSRLLCPEYAEPTAYAGGPPPPRVLLGRVPFQPALELPTPEAERLVREVDALFREAWDAGLIQPREMLNELADFVAVHVNGVRNEVEGDPWKERVTAAQVVRLGEYRDALRALLRGTLPASELLRGLPYVPLRILLSCPATLRDRLVNVRGTVWWERSPQSPHDVVALHLVDDGLEVRLHWAGKGPVAEIAPALFARHPGAGSWWTVSVGLANGAQAVLLHDFLGIQGLASDAFHTSRR